MANKVNVSPYLPLPVTLLSFSSIGSWSQTLISTLLSEFREHALRLNSTLVNDGSEAAAAPVIYKRYAKAALPSASKYVDGMIIVTDDVGGLTPAFSDGTNWRRTADRNIIS
jgi:hypothetical protein